MKKIINLILLIVFTFSLTGCVKYHMTMEVGSDKKVSLEMIYALNQSAINNAMGGLGAVDDESSESNNDYESYKVFESKGFIVSEYTEETKDGTFEGIKLSKTYPHIDKISSDKEVVIDLYNKFNPDDIANFDDSIYFTKKGNRYIANFKFDIISDDGMDMSVYASNFDMKYKIKLHSKAISHNATEVSEDGKELTWELKYGKTNMVNFEFEIKDNTVMIIISSLFFVSSCGVLGLVIFKTKKNKKPINLNN